VRKILINEADFAKALNVLGHIEEMKAIIQARNWDGLERQSELRCQEYAGEVDSHRISGVSLRPYQESLTTGLSAAVAKATALGARAIYFEFDTDYEWRSSFFICPAYPRQWERLLGIDYLEEMEGPEMPTFAKIYGEFDAFTPRETTMESYLIARTFACFGRASQQITDAGFAIGIAFHDQGEIIQMCHGAEVF